MPYCRNCNTSISVTDAVCPYCNYANYHYDPTAKPSTTSSTDRVPKTIAELKEWYRNSGLPPESTTRFFIGTNYTGKRAFGIYQQGDEFIVYKNKDTGARAIRYQGPDEAFAVK